MARTLPILVLLAVLATALAACDSAEEARPEPAPDSGIRGVVLVGPQCPVERENSPCPDEPLQATIDVYTEDRLRKMTSVTSSADGRFEVPLDAGDYYLEPLPPNPDSPLPVGAPLAVTVAPGRWTDVTVSYDSGIR